MNHRFIEPSKSKYNILTYFKIKDYVKDKAADKEIFFISQPKKHVEGETEASESVDGINMMGEIRNEGRKVQLHRLRII